MTDAPRISRTPTLRFQDCRLRPLAAADSDRLLAWRNQDRVRSNMYSDHVIQPDEHARWFASALLPGSAAYLIYEYKGRSTGFVSFVDIDLAAGRCSGGLYIGEVDAPHGSGRALQFLALDHAFGVIGVKCLRYEVFAFNQAAVKLYQGFGFMEEGHRTAPKRRDGQPGEVILFSRFADTWPKDRLALAVMVFESFRT